jgi:hypothetical protein
LLHVPADQGRHRLLQSQGHPKIPGEQVERPHRQHAQGSARTGERLGRRIDRTVPSSHNDRVDVAIAETPDRLLQVRPLGHNYMGFGSGRGKQLLDSSGHLIGRASHKRARLAVHHHGHLHNELR